MRVKSIIPLLLVMFAGLFSACGGDTPQQQASCTFDADCELGQVCQVRDKVCITAACDFCTPEQICYKPTPDSAGSCSAPECSSDAECGAGESCRNGQCGVASGCSSPSDCEDGETCNFAGQCVPGEDGPCESNADCGADQVCKEGECVAGCAEDTQCDDGQYCTAENTCADGCRDSMECPTGQVCTDGDCACNDTSCPDGKVCLDTGNCGDPTSCDQIDCGEQVCNPATLMCQDRCTADSCEAHEACNQQTGLCEVNNCPGEDPNQCAGNATRPVWDPIRCFCAECLSDNDCNVAAGETCNSGGTCFACQTPCDPSTPGTCAGNTPYCISNCCVECVGAADCAAGQLCLDGQCGEAPNCTVDPSVCPAGYTCNNGQCQPPQSSSCDPSNPTSCPQGTFCDPTTSMCTGAGGGFGCGLCNPDCTCDNGLTCNGFLCAGCNLIAQNCPGPNEVCLPFEGNICFPSPF